MLRLSVLKKRMVRVAFGAGIHAARGLRCAPQQGATIAAHAEHLRWSLALSNALARGEQPEGNWEQSWSVRTVTAEESERLRTALRQEYTSLLQAIQARGNLPAELVTPGIAIVAHGAYHLGAIRQMVRLLEAAV